MLKNGTCLLFPLITFIFAHIGPSHSTSHPTAIKQTKKDLPIQFPPEITIVNGQTKQIEFAYRKPLENELTLELSTNQTVLRLEPNRVVLRKGNEPRDSINVTGLSLSSRTYIEVAKCSLKGRSNGTCPFNSEDVFITAVVVKSRLITVLIQITGWIYFSAWSISFYPQIILNFQRKSVIGLNFDFLLLNVIGFACYTVYNVMLYFDPYVQQVYIAEHGQRSQIPVLINDVVFAAHALLACIITVVQCFLYERGTQRVSYICRGWASLLISFSFISLALGVFGVLNWLKFINFLSYTKMAVTLSKYFPQAILNYKRKSTIGWSIGNVLLDFTGGSMDICQMILQAINTNDWSNFVGNPVKFGLGLVSDIFDVLFIIQHYVLYREVTSYNQVDSSDRVPVVASPIGPQDPDNAIVAP